MSIGSSRTSHTKLPSSNICTCTNICFAQILHLSVSSVFQTFLKLILFITNMVHKRRNVIIFNSTDSKITVLILW